MKWALYWIFCCALGFSDLALAVEPSILEPQRYISLPEVLATSAIFSPDFNRLNYGITDQKFFTYVSKNLADGSEVQLKFHFGENDDINNRGSAYLLGNRTFSPDSKTLGWSYIYKTGSERYGLFFEFYNAVTLKKLRTLSFDKDRPVSFSEPGEIFFSPDSRKALLLGQMSSTIEIVDMRDGNVLKLDAADKIWADDIRVTFSTDSSKLVLARDGHVEMFDLTSGRRLWGYYNPGTPTTYSTKVEFFNSESLLLLTFGDFQAPQKQAHLVLDAKDGRELENVGTSASEFGNGGFGKDQSFHEVQTGPERENEICKEMEY